MRLSARPSESVPGPTAATTIESTVVVPRPSPSSRRRTLVESDVVFMYAVRDRTLYGAYGATVLAWGGAHRRRYVEDLRRMGVHPTGSMWCLTAGGRALSRGVDLREGVVRDIRGEPITVPWLPDNGWRNQPAWWGCTNHPAFRAHMRKMVCAAMAGDADGLHVDDHLGTAHPTISYGGCFCDYCMKEFRRYLGRLGNHDALRRAGITDLTDFDYRQLVRPFAQTREEYLAVQQRVPLHRQFVEFQLRRSARNVRQLHRLAEHIVGRPVTLSANTGLPWAPHMLVTPHLTYLVGEVHQHAAQGLAHSADAVVAYRLADALERPLAATACGTDWAFIKAHRAQNLARYWIAQSYACGQRLMTPAKAWCYTPGKGTHYYQGRTDRYAPLYQFVREHAELLDGYRAAGARTAVVFDPAEDHFGGGKALEVLLRLAAANVPFDVVIRRGAWKLGRHIRLRELRAQYEHVLGGGALCKEHAATAAEPASALAGSGAGPGHGGEPIDGEGPLRAALAATSWQTSSPNVWLFPRRPGPRSRSGALPVIHLLNRSYDPATDLFTPQQGLTVTIASGVLGATFTHARLYRPDGPAVSLPVEPVDGGMRFVVEDLPLWGILAFALD